MDQRLVSEEEISQKNQYIRDLFAPEDKELSLIREQLSDGEKVMQIFPEEGKILHLLTTVVQAKSAVEIGMLHGYSSIWIARALGEKGKLYCFEQSDERSNQAIKNFQKCNLEKNIEVITGNALDNLPKIENNGPFDLVFIDADKGNYDNYLEWAENNVRKGGLIIGDNSFLFGSVYKNSPDKGISKKSHASMQRFNKILSNNSKYCSMILPTDQGLTVALKLF